MQHYILRIRLIVMRIRVSPHNHLLCMQSGKQMSKADDTLKPSPPSPPSPNQESEEDLIKQYKYPLIAAIYFQNNNFLIVLIKSSYNF